MEVKDTKRFLPIQDSEIVRRSFYQSPRVSPTIERYPYYLEVRTSDTLVRLGALEEAILYILADFKFIPYWLLCQWLEDFSYTKSIDLVERWVSVELVSLESSALGVFLRPTHLLIEMMNIEDDKYSDIPFGQLNHTCSEAQIMFDIMVGNNQSVLWNMIRDEDTLGRFHPLQLSPTENEQGTIILREHLYKANRYKPNTLLEKDRTIRSEIREGKRFTLEFSDFSQFPIITEISNGIVVKTPDLIVPIPRDSEGNPNSYAIEIELSAKSSEKYIGILEQYKDNIKFGKLFYLCGSKYISNLVTKAFQEVGGLGNCEMYVLPFQSPSMRLKDYKGFAELYSKSEEGE